MLMKRKISLVLIVVLLALLAWYLFLKPNDYLITFKANTFPGAINQTVKTWNKRMGASGLSLEQNGLLHLKQQLQFNDTVVQYDWEIIPLTDSTSKVKVHIKDLKHSVQNKLMIPFTNTVLEKRSKSNLIHFNKLLNEHIKKFRVKVVGTGELQPTYCAYLTVKGPQSDKAFGMMRDYSFLSSFVRKNGIEINGHPFVEITKWNSVKDSIEYDFCFPIIKPDSLPANKEIKYKNFEGFKGLKAIYNGNYITSDRAWYKLIDHAKKNGLTISHKPVEVFHDNPNASGDELDWVAEIYMPLKETDE